MLGYLPVSAQKKIVLQSPKMHYAETHLYDEDDNFLLTLPLTFNISNKNILIMMVGKDTELGNDQAVWLFSKTFSINELMIQDNNVNATKSFKKTNPELSSLLLLNRKVSLYRSFDNGYEIVKKNAKPVFFEISGTSQPVIFYLQFYVSKTDNKYPYVFFAKCKPVEIEITIK